MIQLNKNLLQVRDSNTKEFKPLNVLGTYEEIVLKNEPRTVAAKLIGVDEDKIKLTLSNELDRNFILGDEITIIANRDYTNTKKQIAISVNNFIIGYAWNIPEKIYEDDVFILKCAGKFSQTDYRFETLEITNSVKKEDLNEFATKEDLNEFATKEDLNEFAKKEDLTEFSWCTYQLDTSSTPGNTYYFVSATSTPQNANTLSLSHTILPQSNRSYFYIPKSGNIIITINAWMSSSANQNDIGLFIYDYSGNTWYDYSVAGFGVLGETGKANYISITSCPISVIGGHAIQVVARHYSGNIKVEELNSYGTAYGVPYGNGNTITFRYI